MSKRFTDTKIWDDPWFQSLPIIWKILWKYLCDLCDEAGIWKVNKRQAEFQIGQKIQWEKMHSFLNDGKWRVVEFKNDVWIIKDFVPFQYGEKIFTSNHSFHQRILKTLEKYPINSLSDTLSNRVLDRSIDKETEKAKEEVKEKEEEEAFFIPAHLVEIWPDFLSMRKSIKKPATERAQRNIISELEKLAPSDNQKQIKIIEQSITNSWQGVFQLKDNAQSGFQNKKYGRQELTMEELRDQANSINLSERKGFFGDVKPLLK